MNKTNGRQAIGHILKMMQEDEHITQEFKHFIEGCLSDYLYEKKMGSSLTFLINYDSEMIKKEKIEEMIEGLQKLKKELGLNK